MTEVPALPPVRRRGVLAMQIVLAIVVFAAGLATGAALYSLYNDRRQDYYRKHPEEAVVRFVDRIAKRLDLSGNQRTQLLDIAQRHWPAFQAIRQEMFPRMKVEMDRIRQEIAPTFSPEQLKDWDEYVGEMGRLFSTPASAPATLPAK
jgi:hypothetical protein